MTNSQGEHGEVGKLRLVADRTDFLVVYLASLFTAAAFLSIAAFSNDSMTPSVILFWVGVSAFVSIIPPSLAKIIPCGRRAVQVLFGVALLPVVGAGAIYLNEVIRLAVNQ